MMFVIVKLIIIASMLSSVAFWVARSPFAPTHSDQATDPSPSSAASSVLGRQAAGISPETRSFAMMEIESSLRASLSQIPEATRQAQEGEPKALRAIDARVRELAKRDSEAFERASETILRSVENIPPATAAFLIRSVVYDLDDPSHLLASLMDRSGERHLGVLQIYAMEETGRRLEADPLLLPSQSFLAALVKQSEKSPDLKIVRDSEKLLSQIRAAGKGLSEVASN